MTVFYAAIWVFKVPARMQASILSLVFKLAELIFIKALNMCSPRSKSLSLNIE
jgi:hypothetical protein